MCSCSGPIVTFPSHCLAIVHGFRWPVIIELWHDMHINVYSLSCLCKKNQTNTNHPVRLDFICPLSCSFTSSRRTVAMRAPAWVCPAGPCTTSTTAPPQTCGCTEPTVAICTTTVSRRWRSAALRRATLSPACWTWRPEQSHLARTERCEFAATDAQLLSPVSSDALKVSVSPTGTKVGLRGRGRHGAVPMCDVL